MAVHVRRKEGGGTELQWLPLKWTQAPPPPVFLSLEHNMMLLLFTKTIFYWENILVILSKTNFFFETKKLCLWHASVYRVERVNTGGGGSAGSTKQPRSNGMILCSEATDTIQGHREITLGKSRCLQLSILILQGRLFSNVYIAFQKNGFLYSISTYKNSIMLLGMMIDICHSVLGRLRKDHEFESSTEYIGRHYFKSGW